MRKNPQYKNKYTDTIKICPCGLVFRIEDIAIEIRHPLKKLAVVGQRIG